MKDLRNHSLKAHNTFGIEVRCRRFMEFSSVEEACRVAEVLRETEMPYIIIGGGSNILLTRDFDGIVVRSDIKGMERNGNALRCGSGETWDDVVQWTIRNGLTGAENLSIIPGDVGASAVQNIGAYGAEVKDLIESVEVVEIATGEWRRFSNADCRYAYRDSRFKHDWKGKFLITHVTYLMEHWEAKNKSLNVAYGNIKDELERRGIGDPTPEQLREVIIDIRNRKLPDPKVMGNAGSFFMNPVVSRTKYEALAKEHPTLPHFTIDENHEKIPAGWMIEQCGWKGKSLGRAGVHDRQALVLVNRGGATGNEIVTLCQRIQQDVSRMFGIDIKPEVNII